MSTITIEINAPELVQAINNLAVVYSKYVISNTQELNQIVEPYNEAQQQRTVTSDSTDRENNSSPADTPSDVVYTIEDVRAAFSAYAKAKGKEKAKELLAKFGANKVTALDSANYTAVMNDIKEA